MEGKKRDSDGDFRASPITLRSEGTVILLLLSHINISTKKKYSGRSKIVFEVVWKYPVLGYPKLKKSVFRKCS